LEVRVPGRPIVPWCLGGEMFGLKGKRRRKTQ
jgi:hypothetical protein